MNQVFDSAEETQPRISHIAALRSGSVGEATALASHRGAALFPALLIVMIVAGLARSWIATGLDSLQIDEAWHAVAGVSYVRTGDFRLNPEHPPLVKLWVGATMPASYVLRPFRVLDDKVDERKFIDENHSLANNPAWAQRQMRVSMFALNGALLIALGFCLRRAVGSSLALVAVAWLLIDPTIAAHLPVVLTDLPVALLSSITVLQAVFAFRSWRVRDLSLASTALGLTLATKHSALVMGFAILLLGLACAFAWKRSESSNLTVTARLTRLAAVFLGAYAILWGCYGFRFDERGASAAQAELAEGTKAGAFNRPIDDKISDLSRPSSRAPIQLALDWRMLPRAYLWGLADIARVGLEGRTDTYVLGKLFRGDTPWYFFPLMIAIKLPLGLLCFALAGGAMLARRRTRIRVARYALPLAVLLGWMALHMFLLMRGNSGYAGVRHALTVYPVIAVLAGVPIVTAVASKSWLARSVGVAGLVLTLAMVVPKMRPWEYFNELIGGPDNAWRSFSDEGVDSGQRVGELVRYYNDHLRDSKVPVYDFYGVCEPDRKLYKLGFAELGADPNDPARSLEGVVFVSTTAMVPSPLYDYAAFRQAGPAARFGNLLVLQGKFDIPWLPAERKSTAAFEELSKSSPDKALAEKLLIEVTELYPQDYQSTFELANLQLERGDKQAAVRAYEQARKYARGNSYSAVNLLTEQIEALNRGQSARVIRAPWLE
jgi:hypothetical protein